MPRTHVLSGGNSNCVAGTRSLNHPEGQADRFSAFGAEREVMNVGGLRKITSKSKEIELKIMHVRKRMRMNVELDRLSSLPDDLIHKILSFIDIKHVVQTSLLSSRWMFVWTSTPYLNFSMDDSATLLEFSNVVKRVLSGRNNEIDVSSVKLLLRGMVNRGLVKRIIYYAFSHNVQEMAITSLGKKIVFPLYLFNSKSLKHFTLRGPGYSTHSLRVTSTLDLPSLTTLHLDQVTINVDNSDSYIAKCFNLKSLTVNHCKMMGSSGFTICHPQLLSLTLISTKGLVKVIAPQLKNIYLVHSHYNSFPCFSNNLLSLEKVDICIGYSHRHRALKIIDMLQQLCSVKYLTMNVEIVEPHTTNLNNA
ncbi:F-box/LRR-repeat protein At3g26922-like [Rutidosis leptorrhynchoides]|uniref:F-box/LRR-repeat protein At3g26922-like n=1 Tax=Rutidosis leptorrhynchoides TaxID=125765 RepID=UPI003A992275